MGERLLQSQRERVSQAYETNWRKATGQHATDPRAFSQELRNIAYEIYDKVAAGEIDIKDLHWVNNLYMGVARYPDFPPVPKPDIVKQN